MKWEEVVKKVTKMLSFIVVEVTEKLLLSPKTHTQNINIQTILSTPCNISTFQTSSSLNGKVKV